MHGDLDTEKAKHIDHGYTAEKANGCQQSGACSLAIVPSSQDSRRALTKLNPKIRDLAIYTSDSANTLRKDHSIANESLLTTEGISNAPKSRQSIGAIEPANRTRRLRNWNVASQPGSLDQKVDDPWRASDLRTVP